jgi:D-alanyl-D-alanine carboxypeptidase (penicillin-binding protein 5/6)
MNSPSPLQGGRRRRNPQRWAPAALVLLVLAGMFTWIVVIATSSGGGGSDASPGRVQAAIARPTRNPNPNRKLGGPLPLQAPPGISLAAPNAVTVRLHPKPGGAVLFDLDSGRVLWQWHALRIRPIASVTKIMTALIVSERVPAGATALITKEALRYRGSEVGVLPRGRRVPVETLLYGAMLPSGNDAAVALAERVAGTERDFVKIMNARARQLGLGCTHFVTSYGLQDGNRSCPADLAALTRVVMRQPRIAEIVRHRRAHLYFPYLKGKHLDLYSTNPLLRLGYRGTIGLKTGYTNPAGHCLVAVVRRHGHTLGAVLLKSDNTGGQAMQLLNAGFRALRGA